MRKRYRVRVAGGYTTWCWAVSQEAAETFAQKRYGHISSDIQVSLDEVKP